MKKNNLVVIGVIVLVIGVSLFAINYKSNEPNELEGQGIKQMVNDLSTGNQRAKSASITSQKLIVTDTDNNKQTYSLPDDEFFVSIAPYVEGTHPCATHNLSGCQGELTNEEFDVRIEDNEGNLIPDKKLQSYSNGFIDLWLPREKTYSIKITKDGKTATSEFSTFESDDTCISTMQLM